MVPAAPSSGLPATFSPRGEGKVEDAACANFPSPQRGEGRVRGLRLRRAVLTPDPEAARKNSPYSRVQVCDLQRTFRTQPFIFSELPETVPEPL